MGELGKKCRVCLERRCSAAIRTDAVTGSVLSHRRPGQQHWFHRVRVRDIRHAQPQAP